MSLLLHEGLALEEWLFRDFQMSEILKWYVGINVCSQQLVSVESLEILCVYVRV